MRLKLIEKRHVRRLGRGKLLSSFSSDNSIQSRLANSSLFKERGSTAQSDCEGPCLRYKYDGVIIHSDQDRKVAFDVQQWMKARLLLESEHCPKVELIGNIDSVESSRAGLLETACLSSATVIILCTTRYDEDQLLQQEANGIWSLKTVYDLHFIPLLHGYQDNRPPPKRIAVWDAHPLRFDPSCEHFKDSMQKRLSFTLRKRRQQHDKQRTVCKQSTSLGSSAVTAPNHDGEALQEIFGDNYEQSVLMDSGYETIVPSASPSLRDDRQDSMSGPQGLAFPSGKTTKSALDSRRAFANVKLEQSSDQMRILTGVNTHTQVSSGNDTVLKNTAFNQKVAAKDHCTLQPHNASFNQMPKRAENKQYENKQQGEITDEEMYANVMRPESKTPSVKTHKFDFENNNNIRSADDCCTPKARLQEQATAPIPCRIRKNSCSVEKSLQSSLSNVSKIGQHEPSFDICRESINNLRTSYAPENMTRRPDDSDYSDRDSTFCDSRSVENETTSNPSEAYVQVNKTDKVSIHQETDEDIDTDTEQSDQDEMSPMSVFSERKPFVCSNHANPVSVRFSSDVGASPCENLQLAVRSLAQTEENGVYENTTSLEKPQKKRKTGIKRLAHLTRKLCCCCCTVK